MIPDPTRAAGLARLAAFAPKMGRAYAAGRNTDRGPGRHTHVSTLSPYTRRRLVLETELVEAALAAHGPEAAQKFIAEVVWRGYFKGWLERRPQVWDSYRDRLEADLAELESDRRLAKAVARAEAGETGIAPFDAWVQELVETGYLHNHARMWFASIWIFTLGLPWRVGADFFLRHLLDGDAASNTLSWRWVGGLHTRGKAYAAREDNIARYTDGRFQLRPGTLAEVTETLEGTEPAGLPPILPLRPVLAPDPALPTLLLITDEDGRIEDFVPTLPDLRAVVTLVATHLRSPRPVAEGVAAFDAGMLADTAARAGLTPEAIDARDPADLARLAARAGAHQIATPYATRGPLHDWLTAAQPALAARGIRLVEWTRPWDRAIWPHATAGFFKVSERLPRIIDELGLDRQGALPV
jgi:deoxyribodipyrimidine photo-lyase